MIRGLRAAVNSPKRALPCAPVAGSNRAAVSNALNWVWLNALYISARNCRRARSLIGKILNKEMSKLFTPGPRSSGFCAVPIVPFAGSRKTLVSKFRLKVRSPLGSAALPMTSMRAARFGVPVTSYAVVVL
jgi:hypothetical protein